MLRNPFGNLVIGRAGGDKQPVSTVVKLSEPQPCLIERTIRVVFAFPSDEVGAAFVQGAGGQHVARQRFARAARKFLAVPKIAGQQLYFFEVFFHGFSSIETDTAGEEDSP